MTRLKHWFFNIIDEEHGAHPWAKVVDHFITFLILLSVAAIILESMHEYADLYGYWLRAFEIFVVAIFTIEYFLRVECADLPSYKTFHTDVLGTLPHVTSITSYVVMGSPKDLRA